MILDGGGTNKWVWKLGLTWWALWCLVEQLTYSGADKSVGFGRPPPTPKKKKRKKECRRKKKILQRESEEQHCAPKSRGQFGRCRFNSQCKKSLTDSLLLVFSSVFSFRRPRVKDVPDWDLHQRGSSIEFAWTTETITTLSVNKAKKKKRSLPILFFQSLLWMRNIFLSHHLYITLTQSTLCHVI